MRTSVASIKHGASQEGYFRGGIVSRRHGGYRLDRRTHHEARGALEDPADAGRGPQHSAHWAVAIDEALELARQFSGEESVHFVNGVLDAVRRELTAETVPNSAP